MHEEAVNKYEAMVRMFLKGLRYLADATFLDEEDIMQELWVAVFEALRCYKEGMGTKQSTYVYKGLKMKAYDLVNLRKKEIEKVSLESSVEDADDITLSEMIPSIDLCENINSAVWVKEFLDGLSDQAKFLAVYILNDDGVDSVESPQEVIRYWKKLEKKFGGIDLSDIKFELECRLLSTYT